MLWNLRLLKIKIPCELRSVVIYTWIDLNKGSSLLRPSSKLLPRTYKQHIGELTNCFLKQSFKGSLLKLRYTLRGFTMFNACEYYVYCVFK